MEAHHPQVAAAAAFCCVVSAAALVDRRRRRRRQRQRERYMRRYWVRQWLLRRPAYGYYEHLIPELAREDRSGFINFLRVDPQLFLELLARVGPRIQKRVTRMRSPIGPGLRLAITLRYLATGKQCLVFFLQCFYKLFRYSAFN